MNPFIPKIAPRNKLLTRFNISLNNRTERTEAQQINRLSSSREKEENLIRYRKHIDYLEERIQEQDDFIERLTLEIQANKKVQEQLNEIIEKFKRENRNIWENLNEAENKISDLEFKKNHEMLCRSIKKIDQELGTNRDKRKPGFQECLENPQKQEFQTLKNHLKISPNGLQSLARQSPPFVQLATASQLYQITINSNANIKIPQDSLEEQMKNKQTELKSQKQRCSKLQQAIYYLKKQMKEKSQSSERVIVDLSINLQKQKEKSAKQSERLAKLCNTQMQLTSRIQQYLKKIQQKDGEILEIEEKYSKDLKQAEEAMVKYNDQIQILMTENQRQIRQLQKENRDSQEIIKELQSNKIQLETKLQQKAEEAMKNEKQCNNLLFMISELKSEYKNTIGIKDQQISDLSDKFMLAERELKHIYFRMNQHQQKQTNHSKTNNNVEEDVGVKIQIMKTQFQNKNNNIQQREKKYLALSKRVTELEQAHEVIKKNERDLKNNLNTITKQVQELQQIKESHQIQLQKAHKKIEYLQKFSSSQTMGERNNEDTQEFKKNGNQLSEQQVSSENQNNQSKLNIS